MKRVTLNQKLSGRSVIAVVETQKPNESLSLSERFRNEMESGELAANWTRQIGRKLTFAAIMDELFERDHDLKLF